MSRDDRRTRFVVIGVGNRDRGDDAVGPLIADAVRDLHGDGVDTFVCEGDLSDLAMRWSAHDRVVVVDAMVSGRPPGSIVETDACRSTMPTGERILSSHGVGLADAIELGRLLDRLPRQLTVIGVEASSFEPFEPASSQVVDAVPEVVRRIGEIVTSQIP